MPASRNYLIEGVDVTSTECLSPQDLINLVRAAAPESDIGFIITGAQPPNVQNNPETARFLYLSGDGFLYRYKTNGWELIKGAFSLSQSDKIYIDQLNPRNRNTPGESQANRIIKVNNDGDSFIFADITTVVNSADINVGSLHPASETSVLIANNNQSKWVSLAEFWTYFSGNSLNKMPVNILDGTGAANKVISSNGTSVQWMNFNDAIPDNHIAQSKIIHRTESITVGTSPITLDCSTNYSFKLILNVDAAIRIANLADGGSIQILVVLNGKNINAVEAADSNVTFKWPDDAMPPYDQSHEVVISISRFANTLYGTLVPGYQ